MKGGQGINSFCVCVMADLIGSRRMDNLSALDKLVEELAALAGHQASYMIPPVRRAGDELFFVADKALVVPALRRMHEARKKLPMYIGLGTGWTHDLHGDHHADRMEGPVIFRAADALRELKEKPDSEVLRRIGRDAIGKPTQFRCNLHAGEDKSVNLMVTGHLMLLLQMVERRGALQCRAVALKRQYPDQPARMYAHQLWAGSKNPPKDAVKSFSKHLMRAEYALVEEMIQTFVEALAYITPGGDVV